MIADRIEHASLYRSISPRIAQALELLRTDIVHRENGRHDVEGDSLFCLVQRYVSKPAEECNLETHRKYLDVQCVVSGEETIRWTHPAGLEIASPYDADLDREYYRPREGMSEIRLAAGSFAIFFPQDAHQPCIRTSGPCEVHKVVLKVRISE